MSPTSEAQVAKLKCTSDRYDCDGTRYDSVDDFLEMCEAVFDVRPKLTERIDGWHDSEGLVLVQTRSAPVVRRSRRGPPDGERDQMDYAWNEPGAPFRSADY
jgi:hypothetical protein